MPGPVITLVGCGKMGSALLRGWLAAKISETIYVIEPYGLPDEFSGSGVIHTDSLQDSDVIVLSVKPQIMPDVCAALTPAKNTLILSIAAGQKIENFRNYFGVDQPIIRAMPNTPASIGKGMTVAVSSGATTSAHRKLTDDLLSVTGLLEWVDDETVMDAVTALSGSGPAYVFALIEMMAHAGEKAGLPGDFSMTLARQTVIGAAALADAEQNTTISDLRKNVTSPGGTTEAALITLMDGKMQKIVTRAILAAAIRSRDLS